MGKRVAVGLVALGIVVGSSLYAFSRTEHGGRCPADRNVMMMVSFNRAADAKPFESLIEAASAVAEHYGYDQASDVEKVVESAAGAELLVSPAGAVTYTFDPDLPDTDVIVDLHISVRKEQNGEYVPAASSFCARVVDQL